jgi:hypothetical protein
VLGRKVRTLVNENIPAGSHTVTFDATGLASGVYVYRLSVPNMGEDGQAGSLTLMKRMMLVK